MYSNGNYSPTTPLSDRMGMGYADNKTTNTTPSQNYSPTTPLSDRMGIGYADNKTTNTTPLRNYSPTIEVYEQIGYPISDDPITLGELLSNVVMMYSAAAQGLGNFSESVMDASLTLVEIPIGGITYGIDSIFGTDLNSITIGSIDDFIATEHVNNLFEYVHTKTPFSVFSENATEGLKYGGEVYTVTSGAANITAKIAAVMLLSPYLGPAGASFLVGGVTGMGEYREDALQNGADTIPSMVAAFAGGTWEGLQWGLGGKLSGTGVVAILSDGTTGALDTPIRSYIISTASGKDFNEVFEQYGGTGAMFLGGTFGTIFSSLGEISDIFTKGQNINVSHKNMPDDALGISLNPAPTSQQFMQQLNIDDNIQKLRNLMNDSNIVNGYSDYLLTTKNEYARLWDEFDIGRRELQQTYQTVFKDSGFEDAVSYLDQFGLSKGQGNNYGVRVIEHYIKTGDSSVFPREYGLRNYFTSYRTADLADMLELDNAYRNISSGNLITMPLSLPSDQVTSSYRFYKNNRGYDGSYGIDQHVTANLKPNSIEYQNCMDYLRKQGFSRFSAKKILKHLDDTGACSYASVTDIIFQQFKNKPEEFERIFGYPYMINGHLNDAQLLTDLYVYANSTENGGRMFTDGMFSKKIQGTSQGQVYMSDLWTSQNENLINNFLKSKDPNITFEREVLAQRVDYRTMKFSPITGEEMLPNYSNVTGERVLYDTSSLRKDIDNALANNQSVSMGISDRTNNPQNTIFIGDHITFHSLSGSNNVSTTNWNEGGGHAMNVLDTDDMGVIVNTWGGIYRINWSDLSWSEFTVEASKININ